MVLPAIYKPRLTDKNFAEPERYTVGVYFFIQGPTSRDEAKLMVRIIAKDLFNPNYQARDLPSVTTGEMFLGSFDKKFLDQSVYMDVHLDLQDSRGSVALFNLPLAKLLAEDFSGFELNMKLVEN